MKKKKIPKVVSTILLTSTITLGSTLSVVKAGTIDNSISGVKNVVTSIKNTLAENYDLCYISAKLSK